MSFWLCILRKQTCRYEDDKDEGEWFLYTGSGGRDLSGNKRVSKVQSFDQTFDKMNKALLLSCEVALEYMLALTYSPQVHALLAAKCCVHNSNKLWGGLP